MFKLIVPLYPRDPYRAVTRAAGLSLMRIDDPVKFITYPNLTARFRIGKAE